MNYKIVLAPTSNVWQTGWPRGDSLPRIAFAAAHSLKDEAHQQTIFDQCQEIFTGGLGNIQAERGIYNLHGFVPSSVPFAFEKDKFLILVKMDKSYSKNLDQNIQKFNLMELQAGFSPLVVQEKPAHMQADLIFLFSLDLKWRKSHFLMSFWTHAIRDFILGKDLGTSPLWKGSLWTPKKLEKFVDVLPNLVKSSLTWKHINGFKTSATFKNCEEHKWLLANQILL